MPAENPTVLWALTAPSYLRPSWWCCSVEQRTSLTGQQRRTILSADSGSSLVLSSWCRPAQTDPTRVAAERCSRRRGLRSRREREGGREGGGGPAVCSRAACSPVRPGSHSWHSWGTGAACNVTRPASVSQPRDSCPDLSYFITSSNMESPDRNQSRTSLSFFSSNIPLPLVINKK